LLKADLTDLSAVVPAAADVSEPIEVMQDERPRRTVRYLAEPFLVRTCYRMSRDCRICERNSRSLTDHVGP
jgi:hypothetical protein